MDKVHDKKILKALFIVKVDYCLFFVEWRPMHFCCIARCLFGVTFFPASLASCLFGVLFFPASLASGDGRCASHIVGLLIRFLAVNGVNFQHFITRHCME